MTRTLPEQRYVIALQFCDGTAYVADTAHPRRYITAITRLWPQEPAPHAWIIAIHPAYWLPPCQQPRAMAKARALLAKRTLRATNPVLGPVITYPRALDSFSASTMAEARAHHWLTGEDLWIDGLTAQPGLRWRSRRWLAVSIHRSVSLPCWKLLRAAAKVTGRFRDKAAPHARARIHS